MNVLSIADADLWRTKLVGRRNWKRQITFVTPLDRLAWYAPFLLEHLRPFESVMLRIDQVIFNAPPRLDQLRAKIGELRSIHDAPGHLFGHDDPAFADVLTAALSKQIDFRLFCQPFGRALRVDHDEHTTFFAESSEKITEIERQFRKNGLKQVDWTAEPA